MDQFDYSQLDGAGTRTRLMRHILLQYAIHGLHGPCRNGRFA